MSNWHDLYNRDKGGGGVSNSIITCVKWGGEGVQLTDHEGTTVF
jgi:hypothetical protein